MSYKGILNGLLHKLLLCLFEGLKMFNWNNLKDLIKFREFLELVEDCLNFLSKFMTHKST